jgi:hypothetical protein
LPVTKDLTTDIFTLPQGFDSCCLDVFRFQSLHNRLYRNFIGGLNIDPLLVTYINEIPFLPVELFKSHQIMNEGMEAKIVFSSSGTSGTIQSKHYVAEPALYEQSFRTCFNHFYGDITDYCILALLPSYLEREGSSLILMAQDLISSSMHPESGFYLHNQEDLHNTLLRLEARGQKTLLLGVTYALLDFAESYQMQLKNTVVMETGGMKGRRKELVREELHDILCSRLGVKTIHSEYGMTELLSQAYSTGIGLFKCPPWMKVIVRDTTDPLSLVPIDRSGGINIIDLANLYSCSFIATQDLGKVHVDGSFEILGRFDNSDVRGCNLMMI